MPNSEYIEWLAVIIGSPIKALTALQSPMSPPFVACAMLTAAAFFIFGRRGRRRSLKGALRFALPRKILLHPSAILDYKYFFVGTMLRTIMAVAFFVSSGAISAVVVDALSQLGPVSAKVPNAFAAAVITVAYILALDLGYWIGHRLSHNVPVLWEFHKAHHAAEVLTPATSVRSHPIDDVVQGNCIAIVTGLTHGVTSWVFGPDAQPLSLFGINILMFVYYVTFFHLRHSHVWLPVRGWLGYVIQSPAHHQIHHSDAPHHMGKNLGFCLSIWDWVFGTLYIPTKKEALNFGIGEESKEYLGLRALLVKPFVNAAALMLPARFQSHPASPPNTAP
jgi:sterol desaturase/sphingolipid hydroxylase (fatty acid hydroxylase superfamily)